MTLAVRVIPVLLRRGGSLVKGIKFQSWRSVGHPLQAARIHAAREVDELIYLDVGATPRGHGPDLKAVERLTESAFIPVTVGGGVRNVDDVRDLLSAGADKVAICTNTENVISEAAERFGSQAIVAGIDVSGGQVFINCGKRPISKCPASWAKKIEMMGAGEILLQSIDRDGMMNGYDLDLIHITTEELNIPLIASCGAGTYQHMLEAVRAGASGVAAGAIFQFTDSTPYGAKQFLHDAGVSVRL